MAQPLATLNAEPIRGCGIGRDRFKIEAVMGRAAEATPRPILVLAAYPCGAVSSRCARQLSEEHGIMLTTWSPSDGPATLRLDPDILAMPLAAREYCARKGIVEEVRSAISLARQCFEVSGDPVFEVVEDPEHGEDLLAIHVWARGDPEEVFRQSDTFLDSYLPTISWAKQQHISLIYHPVQT